ncbi:MAG: ABC transporter substrate-binding protein [Actinomycetota bacterium]
MHAPSSPLARLLAALVAVVLVAAACGSSDDTASGSSPSESAPTATTAPADPTPAPEPGRDDGEEPAEAVDPTPEPAVDETPVFPRTITDALGEVEIPDAPMRVVALDQSLLDVAFVLGLEVIGYTTFSDPDGPLPEIYADVAGELAPDAIWMGDLFAPNLELIAQAEPDIILTAAVRHEAIADQLSQIAPTVMSESAGAGFKDSLRLAAEATGREQVAEAALAAYEERAASIGDAIRAERGDPTISVVRFVDVIRLYQPISFSGVVLSDVGLSRPASQQNTDDFITVISPEEIQQADADVLVYATFDNEEVEAVVTEFIAGPLWGALGAVQAGEVHAVADQRWMSGVGLFGAQAILDDLETIFGLDLS